MKGKKNANINLFSLSPLLSLSFLLFIAFLFIYNVCPFFNFVFLLFVVRRMKALSSALLQTQG
jgi:hypothetical protein